MKAFFFPINIFLAFLPACSDPAASSTESSAAQGASGLSRSRTLASLTEEEASKLCAWSLATEGGAGKVTDCGGGRSTAVHTNDECLESLKATRTVLSCYPVTVGEAEDCSAESAKSACTNGPICEAINGRLETCAGKD